MWIGLGVGGAVLLILAIVCAGPLGLGAYYGLSTVSAVRRWFGSAMDWGSCCPGRCNA
ncbi:hypothetical protein GCM10009557_76930 [Virgisporangium ochraceum]